MDFRLVPSDPVCFDKLSCRDAKTGIWQYIRTHWYNRCVTGRRPCDENLVVRFGQSAENCSQAWNMQLIKSSLTSLQGGASAGTPWLLEEEVLSLSMSLHLSQLTTNCGPFSRIKQEIYFHKEAFRSFIEVVKHLWLCFHLYYGYTTFTWM